MRARSNQTVFPSLDCISAFLSCSMDMTPSLEGKYATVIGASAIHQRVEFNSSLFVRRGVALVSWTTPGLKMGFLAEALSLLHPHYVTNLFLSSMFYILKVTPPICSMIFNDCQLELVSSGIIAHHGMTLAIFSISVPLPSIV